MALVSGIGDYPRLLFLCSVIKSCPILYNPIQCSTPGFPVLHYLPEFPQIHVLWVSDATWSFHPVTCFSWPQSFPASGSFPVSWVFSSELALHTRWPKYWSFSLSISPFNQYSGLISFRIDWFDLLAVQGIPKSFLQNHSSKASVLFFFFVVNFVIHWNETAMGLHVFPIPIPPPTSLSPRSL